MTWLTYYGISVSLVENTSRSFSHSWLIIGFVTRLTRRVSLVEQEQLTLPGHLSTPTVFGGVRVARSLVLCVCFVDRCLSFRTFSFGNCVVCSSSIYGFWLPLWYHQTLLITWCFIEYTSQWAGFELITSMVIVTDCIDNCESRFIRWRLRGTTKCKM